MKQLQNKDDLINLSHFFRRDNSGVLEFRGNDRLDFLNRLSTNDIRSLAPATGAATVLTNEKGRIIDVLFVTQWLDKSLVVCSPNNGENVIRWLKKYLIMDDVKIADQTTSYCQFELHGESIHEHSHFLFGTDTDIKPLFHPRELIIDDAIPCIVFRVPSPKTFAVKIMTSKEHDGKLSSYLAQYYTEIDTHHYQQMKIVYGMPSFGTELRDSYNPLEAGLLHYVNFKKGCYIGQEVIARLDSYNKVKQRIIGLISRHQLSAGDTLVAEGQSVGNITSVFCDESTQSWYGLGYIRNEYAIDDTYVNVNDHSVYISSFPLETYGT